MWTEVRKGAGAAARTTPGITNTKTQSRLLLPDSMIEAPRVLFFTNPDIPHLVGVEFSTERGFKIGKSNPQAQSSYVNIPQEISKLFPMGVHDFAFRTVDGMRVIDRRDFPQGSAA